MSARCARRAARLQFGIVEGGRFSRALVPGWDTADLAVDLAPAGISSSAWPRLHQPRAAHGGGHCGTRLTPRWLRPTPWMARCRNTAKIRPARRIAARPAGLGAPCPGLRALPRCGGRPPGYRRAAKPDEDAMNAPVQTASAPPLKTFVKGNGAAGRDRKQLFDLPFMGPAAPRRHRAPRAPRRQPRAAPRPCCPSRPAVARKTAYCSQSSHYDTGLEADS